MTPSTNGCGSRALPMPSSDTNIAWLVRYGGRSVDEASAMTPAQRADAIRLHRLVRAAFEAGRASAATAR